MAVNLRGLIAKLNAPTRSAVEAAAGLCLSRTNYDVEIEHFLVKVLDASDGDTAVILKHFGVNRTRLADDVARALDKIKRGNARTPSLSPSLVSTLSEAWSIGSIEYGAPRVRTGHVLLALLTVSADEDSIEPNPGSPPGFFVAPPEPRRIRALVIEAPARSRRIAPKADEARRQCPL